jgi:glutaconate CoA-transferase subunit A
MDPLLASAADLVLVQVERVVSNEQVRKHPGRTRFWPRALVVEAALGTHPFSGTSIVADEDHLRDYVRAAEAAARGERAELDKYLRHFVHEAPTHRDYLGQVGSGRISSLRI